MIQSYIDEQIDYDESYDNSDFSHSWTISSQVPKLKSKKE